MSAVTHPSLVLGSRPFKTIINSHIPFVLPLLRLEFGSHAPCNLIDSNAKDTMNEGR